MVCHTHHGRWQVPSNIHRIHPLIVPDNWYDFSIEPHLELWTAGDGQIIHHENETLTVHDTIHTIPQVGL